MDWLELVTLAIGTFIRLLKSFALAFGRLALYFIRLAAYPVAGIWGTLLFVFSPVIQTIRLVLSPIVWLLNSFPRLQPLYIYFGSAAFIGLAVGLVFKFTSTFMLTILNLYDDPNDAAPSPSTTNKLSHPPYSQSFSPDKKTAAVAAAGDDYSYGYEDQDEFSRSTTPHSQFAAEQRNLEMLLANLSSPDLRLNRGRGGGRDSALAALAGSMSSGSGGGWRDSPNIKRKRRSVSGGPLGLSGGGLSSSSRFHTILEEEDDSL